MALSEDVLLMVGHVRHQKKDGTLYVMSERLAWMLDAKDVFQVSHKYSDIKSQKISPDGKAKIQLQIVLHDSATSTFHFVNPVGQEAQLNDRNEVKTLLLQLLPRFQRKVNKELEQKNRLLSENPELFQLYRDLVMSNVITAEEFWSQYAAKKLSSVQEVENQECGVSGAFLAEVKPQSDGCNGLRYNLTTDVIHSVFKTYPAVKQKHLECVPLKMSDSEFWTLFFQSHYFHRDRIPSAGMKDPFADCMRSDEQDIHSELGQVQRDILCDLTKFSDTSVEDGLCGSSGDVAVPSAANKNLIRRFNHHSMMVLKACETEGSPQEPKSSLLNGHHLDSSPPPNKVRLKEKLVYEDLEGDEPDPVVGLHLNHKEGYMLGPTASAASSRLSGDAIVSAGRRLQRDAALWQPDLSQAVGSVAAGSVLRELSPGGDLIRGVAQENLGVIIPEPTKTDLKHLYVALTEILRHFWSCFPVTTKTQEEKLLRVQSSLERFQGMKLQPFQEQLLRDHVNSNVVAHMQAMVQDAYAKFRVWRERKNQLKL